MTTQSIILFFALTAILSCRDISDTKIAGKERMKVIVEVVPEGDSSYSISWKDTIGQSNGYSLSNRPFEVWCLITDESDTLGYYRGLSTPTDFMYFSTTDTAVTTTFMIGPNIFYEQKGSSENRMPEIAVEFNSIHLNLKSGVRKPIEFVLTERRKQPLTVALKKSGRSPVFNQYINN